MPRKCPYRIDLSDAERARFEATARKYTSPYREVIRVRLSATGASASSENVYGVWRNARAPGAQRSFPPNLVVAIKALACQLPYESEVPLSRWSVPEIRRAVIERGLVASIGETTL